MKRKASELTVGDVFVHVYAEVIAVASVAGGKRMKVRIALEDQGQRANCGVLGKGGQRDLEFTDAGHTLEFPGRLFHLIKDWWDDGDDDDELEPAPRGSCGSRRCVKDQAAGACSSPRSAACTARSTSVSLTRS
jgi:hypothetical protein